MRVKRFAQILLAVQAVMVVVLGHSIYVLERRLEALNANREVAFRSYLLADELRQSSDDLTRLSRSFVATGDPQFEREYFAVLDIRKGKLARPTEYNRIYWDLVTPTNPQPRGPGTALPLRQLMLDAGFTQSELAKLDAAREDSDALVRTETLAMNAARGLFDDGSGQFTLQRTPDRELATRLLHDEAYHEAKRRVMRPIDDFYAMFQARTAGAVVDSLASSRAQLSWMIALLAATLALFVGSFLALRRQHVQREAAQQALTESEARYRTIFQMAADGFGLVDTDARLLEVNDALCRMSGYSAEELRSMRVSDLELAEDATNIREHLDHVRTHEDERFSTRLRHRDGGSLDVEVSAQYRHIDSGRFVIVLKDVSDAKRARAELQQRLRFEMLMADLAATFLDATDAELHPLMLDALQRICECFDFAHATVWQPEHGDPQHVVRTHLVTPGESPSPRDGPAVSLSRTLPWLLGQLETNSRSALVLEVASLPPAASLERAHFSQLGVTDTISIASCVAPGKVDGLVEFGSKGGQRPDAVMVAQVETLARMMLVVLSRARDRGARADEQERTRTLLEMLDDAPAGITITSSDALLYANEQAAAMHGFTLEAFAQRTLLELLAPEDRERGEAIQQAIFEHGSHSFFTIWHQRRDGTRLHLETQARRGKFLGRDVIISVFVDLSERDRAEQALRQSEERYRLLAENVSDVITVVNVETGRFEYVSPSVLRLRGYTAEEAMGQVFGHTLTEDSQLRAQQRLAELIEAEQAGYEPVASVEGDAVYHQVRKDGSTVPTEVRSRLLRDPSSGKPLLLSVARDISERKRSELEREELLQQLYQVQKMEAIGGLAGGVAHDFNNLLSVIMSYTDFVVDKLPDDDRRRSDLQEVQRACDRAAGLVRQLLAFSRKQILEPRVIDLNQVVGGVEKMLRRLLGEDVQLDVVLAAGLGSVLADPGQLEQVLMNLIVNARDAMPRGGHLTIETTNIDVADGAAGASSKVTPGRYTAFKVTDSGCGMDEATLRRIFEPFFTTKGPGKGTGLGLSTVYGIVKQSEGEVEVTSQPGVGTEFTVYLPRRDAPLSAPAPRPLVGVSGGSETVLVVEDEDGLRGLIERILRRAGYSVLLAANGSEALALCDEHQGKVDLLLTDVVMPQMSGRELAERLLQTTPKLKVLYMSGYTHEIIGRHGVLEEGMRLIGKPFTAAEMSRTVRMVLDEGNEAVA